MATSNLIMLGQNVAVTTIRAKIGCASVHWRCRVLVSASLPLRPLRPQALEKFQSLQKLNDLHNSRLRKSNKIGSSSPSVSQKITSELQRLEAVESVSVTKESGELSEFPAAPGVYAIYGKDGEMQFMGLTRRLASSIESHAADLPDLCCSIKFVVVDAPDRAALTNAWTAWMEQHVAAGGDVPPGNKTGVTTWTTKKVKRVKPEIRLTPGAHVALNVPITELIDQLVKEFPVVAFIKGTRTAPQCGFSHRVLTILNEHRVDYETLDVLDEDHNPGLREAIKAYSQWPTIPQLYVKGEFVGGADVLDEMVLSGEIKELFKK